ncbi:helix-turn-helix domain-containing protein [Altererythrobacter sp. MTPC7]|uniref:helix-turn-helix domain-containing protein n=1 Tax=Altererythrobacter sp. MTPC7 TaxID=3056567 RepID=UPI0036F3D2A5
MDMTENQEGKPLPNDVAIDDGTKITVKEKWQGAVNEGSGFVAVPMALLRLQSKYELSATDMVVLINLLGHWWEPSSPVYPRSSTIAKRMGVTKRTVQRSTKALEEKGLLQRDKLADGKRVFLFDALAKRVAKDVPVAFVAQATETFGS